MIRLLGMGGTPRSRTGTGIITGRRGLRARAASKPRAGDTPVRRPTARDDGEGRRCIRRRRSIRPSTRRRKTTGAEPCVYVGANSCRRRDARVSQPVALWVGFVCPLPCRFVQTFCFAGGCRERIRSGGFAKLVPTAVPEKVRTRAVQIVFYCRWIHPKKESTADQ
jgi:hypothetical protein